MQFHLPFNVFKLPFTGNRAALLITPQPPCSDCITTWPSPSQQHHWPATLSETHSTHKHDALYIFWGVKTYTINFHVWSSNDLNTLLDLVSVSLDETNHQFFFNTVASNCGTDHSLFQRTHTYTLSNTDIPLLFFISPYLSPFPAINKTWRQKFVLKTAKSTKHIPYHAISRELLNAAGGHTRPVVYYSLHLYKCDCEEGV